MVWKVDLHCQKFKFTLYSLSGWVGDGGEREMNLVASISVLQMHQISKFFACGPCLSSRVNASIVMKLSIKTIYWCGNLFLLSVIQIYPPSIKTSAHFLTGVY